MSTLLTPKKSIILILVLYISASFEAFSQEYNTPESALVIPHENGWESGANTYKLTDHTAEGTLASCHREKNIWFKFTATQPFIRILINSSSPHVGLALFDSDFNQIDCKGGMNSFEVHAENLTEGQTYFFSYEGNTGMSCGIKIMTEYSNNWPQGATEIPHENGWESGANAYKLTDHTAEGTLASCHREKNIWFKFTATQSFIRILINSSSPHVGLALFDSNFNQIDCKGGTNSFEAHAENLTEGQTYFFSYEGNTGMSCGIKIMTEYSNNWPQGATEIPHISIWSSGEAAYTTQGATSITPSGSCGGEPNVWFRFTANTEEISIKGLTNNLHKAIVLFDHDLNEISCARNNNTGLENFILNYSELEKGEAYFISFVGGSTSFGLEISGGTTSLWTVSNGVVHLQVPEHTVSIGSDMIPEGYKLAVKGKVIAEEIKIKQYKSWLWPDYVFEEDYDRMTLAETKAYIDSLHHLPEIPSAATIKENQGFEIGETTTMLLKKIEELTLHLIDLNKKVEENEKLLLEISKVEK